MQRGVVQGNATQVRVAHEAIEDAGNPAGFHEARLAQGLAQSFSRRGQIVTAAYDGFAKSHQLFTAGHVTAGSATDRRVQGNRFTDVLAARTEQPDMRGRSVKALVEGRDPRGEQLGLGS